MEGFFLFLIVIIIFSSLKSGKKKHKTKKTPFKAASQFDKKTWADDAKKLNAARQSASAGSTTLERYRRQQKKKYKSQIKANTGLWRSKHRIDMNKKRRTDWGAQGDKLAVSPFTIGIIGGMVLTVYLGLTAYYG